MLRQRSHERPLVRCLVLTGLGFLAIVPAATFVATFCLICLWVFGVLLLMILLPVYSFLVGTYCARTIRDSSPEWQVLLVTMALASGCVSWFCWGRMNDSVLGFEGYGTLAASVMAGVWVAPTALNFVRLVCRAPGQPVRCEV